MLLVMALSIVSLFFAIDRHAIVDGTDPMTVRFSRCVLKIIRTYSNGAGSNVTLLISFRKPSEYSSTSFDEEKFFSLLNELSTQPLIVLTELNYTTFNAVRTIVPSAYVILSGSYDSAVELLQTVNTSHQSWHPRSKFLLLITNDATEADSAIKVKPVIRELGRVNVYQFVVLLVRRSSSSGLLVDVYNWLPFDDGCGTVVKRANWVGNCDENLTEARLFPSKIPSSFRSCTIRVAVVEWHPSLFIDRKTGSPSGGQDTQNRIITDVKGLRLEYVVVTDIERWGLLSKNGTWSGMMGRVSSGQADMARGMGSIERCIMFDSFSVYSSRELAIFIPLPGKLSYGYNLVHIFSADIWLLIGVGYLICVLFSYRIMTSDGDHSDNLLVYWALIFFSSSLNVSCVIDRRWSKPTMNVLFLAWVIYVYNVNSIYSSFLLTSITTPRYYQPIKSPADIPSSDIKQLIIPQFPPVDHIIDLNNEQLKRKNPRFISQDPRTDIGRFVTQQDMVIIGYTHLIGYTMRNNLSYLNWIPNVQIAVREYIFFRKGNLFFDLICSRELAAFEAGLYQKWYSDIHYVENIRERADQNKLLELGDLKPLTLVELEGIFYVLMFGLLLSCFTFALELIKTPR